MLAAFLKVTAKPGKKQELLQFLRWGAQVARDEEPGTLRFDVYDPGDGDVVFFYEAYVDQAALEAHKANAPYRAFVETIADDCIESFERLMNWTESVPLSPP